MKPNNVVVDDIVFTKAQKREGLEHVVQALKNEHKRKDSLMAVTVMLLWYWEEETPDDCKSIQFSKQTKEWVAARQKDYEVAYRRMLRELRAKWGLK
jgi:hypothetical protein